MAAEDDPDGDAPPADPREVIEAGRRRVTAPAAMLIAVTVFLVGIAFVMALQYGLMTAQFDRQREANEAQIDANPGMTPAQKAQAKQITGRVFQGMGYFIPAFGVMHLIAAGVVGHGAYKMLTVTGRGWAITAAVAAVVPCCVGYAWVVGLPAGVWALVVLNQPDVKAAFRAARRERERELGIDFD